MTREEMIEEFLNYRPFLVKYIYQNHFKEYLDDILQEVALAIWAGNKYQGESGTQFRSWTKVVTRNVIIQMCRGGKNKEHLDIDKYENSIPDTRSESVEHKLTIQDEIREARRILDLAWDLFPSYRTAGLNYIDNMGKVERPEGVGIETYKTWQHRGLDRIRQLKRDTNLAWRIKHK